MPVWSEAEASGESRAVEQDGDPSSILPRLPPPGDWFRPTLIAFPACRKAKRTHWRRPDPAEIGYRKEHPLWSCTQRWPVLTDSHTFFQTFSMNISIHLFIHKLIHDALQPSCFTGKYILYPWICLSFFIEVSKTTRDRYTVAYLKPCVMQNPALSPALIFWYCIQSPTTFLKDFLQSWLPQYELRTWESGTSLNNIKNYFQNFYKKSLYAFLTSLLFALYVCKSSGVSMRNLWAPWGSISLLHFHKF